MVKSYFREAFEYAAKQGKKALIVCDVDLALLQSMSTVTTEQQRQLIGDWHDLSGGNLFFMTGRAHQSLDKAWGRNLPGSFEHHSMMRIEENGDVMRLATPINTKVIGQHARDLIGDQIEIVDTPEEVHEADGKRFVVYVEVKNAAVALVHSQHLPDEVANPYRQILIDDVAEIIIEKMGIQETHHIVQGGDAIEIAPCSHTLCADAERVLPQQEHVRIAERGLGKATGIHNIMSLYGPENVVPFMLGDSSGSDGPAMIACIQHGGYGMIVSNGKTLDANFLMASGNRVIPSFQATWDHISDAVSYLRSTVGKNVVQIPDSQLPNKMVAGMHNT